MADLDDDFDDPGYVAEPEDEDYHEGDNSDISDDEDVPYFFYEEKDGTGNSKDMARKHIYGGGAEENMGAINEDKERATIEEQIAKRHDPAWLKEQWGRSDDGYYNSEDFATIGKAKPSDAKFDPRFGDDQISDSSDAEDPREGNDMGRDFYFDASDDSSGSDLDREELEQIDPNDPVVDQESFQPDPMWNSTIDPQVGLWGSNHPHAPFPGSTVKWNSVVWDDGTTYEGLSRENLPHAYGTLVMGNAYAGNLVEPNVGRGVKYEGMFRAGAVEGIGQLSWPSGKVFRGEWVQGQKHGCGAMYDFSPMIKLTQEGKSPEEAWDETKDAILGAAQMGTWFRDKHIAGPTDKSLARPKELDRVDLCDTAMVQGVLEELEAVVQRSRMFQHKPDGEVAIRYLQDAGAAPAPVSQDPLYYPHDTKWMAPGPVGQTFALPDDAKLKAHLKGVADNYYKIYRMYNLPFKPESDPDYVRAQAYWPEEYFQEGPNSAWHYKHVLYPMEKSIEEDVRFHTDKDASEYRKKGRKALETTWFDRSLEVLETFLDKKGIKVTTAEDKEKLGMIKTFIKDCEDLGMVSAWKLARDMQAADKRRDKEIKTVTSDTKAKKVKRMELMYRLNSLQKDFYQLSPEVRHERGMTLAQDIADFGFMKDFVKAGEVEVARMGEGGKQKLAIFTRLKEKEWDRAAERTKVSHIINPVMDPFDINKLSDEDKKHWHTVLEYLYNDLPEDDTSMELLLTDEQKKFLDFVRSKQESEDAKDAAPGALPGGMPRIGSLSIGLTRFSFSINRAFSAQAKRATRKIRFGS